MSKVTASIHHPMAATTLLQATPFALPFHAPRQNEAFTGRLTFKKAMPIRPLKIQAKFDEDLVTSPKMEKFLGVIKLIDENRVMQFVWAYIGQHDLMGPYVKNAKITTDKKLRTFFGQREEVNRLQIRRLILDGLSGIDLPRMRPFIGDRTHIYVDETILANRSKLKICKLRGPDSREHPIRWCTSQTFRC